MWLIPHAILWLFFFPLKLQLCNLYLLKCGQSSLLNVIWGIMKPLCTVTHFYRTEPTSLLSFHVRLDMLCQAFQPLASIKRQMTAVPELMEHESRSLLCTLNPMKCLSMHSPDLTLLFPLFQFVFWWLKKVREEFSAHTGFSYQMKLCCPSEKCPCPSRNNKIF